MLAIALRHETFLRLMHLMLSNSVNYLAIASIVRFSGLFSPYASKERIPHMNSTSSALPSSGVAPETLTKRSGQNCLVRYELCCQPYWYPFGARMVLADTM